MDIDVFTWIDTDANIDKVIASSIAFLKYKENGLKSKSPNAERNKFQSKTLSLEKFLNAPLPTVSVVRKIPGLAEDVVKKAMIEATDDAAETLGDLLKKEARFRKSVELLSARVKYLCDTLKTQNGIQTLRNEFRAKIKNAILNLRKRVSGTTGSVAKIRAQIERILYDFANSWESFKDSYNMNMVLLGGAGVGKTTLANAFAECLYAFGINSSDSISKPEKPDLIAQYSGQTAPLVYSVLYGSLEGVCFIDEAYSISGKPGGISADFGQEFIDALVEFTQRFPGYLCLIVAGYKKEMKANFFARNEGLYRRFPTVFELLPYPIEDIGRAYINQIIAKRELKLEDQAVYNTVDKALTFHSMLLKLLYFDTTASDIDDYYRMKFGGEEYNFFEKYTFNLEPVLSLIYLSPVENKRNVLKAYILRYVFAIKEGDLFPNQMGDIQNYVDKTLKQENVFFGNTITMDDAQKTMNAYFSIRANHHVYLLDRGQGIPSIEFATHGQTASDFANSVLLPFLKPIVTFEGRTINLNDPIEDNRMLQHLEKAMGELYTKAVSEVYSDFNSEDGEKRPPSFVQYEFLKFEADTLERMNKERIERGETGRTRLKYFETVETREEDSDLSMSGGTMPVRPKKSPAEECGALVRQESGAHKDGLVAAAGSPGAGAPAGVTVWEATPVLRYGEYNIVIEKELHKASLFIARDNLYLTFLTDVPFSPDNVNIKFKLQGTEKVIQFKKFLGLGYEAINNFKYTPLTDLAEPNEIYATLDGKPHKVEIVKGLAESIKEAIAATNKAVAEAKAAAAGAPSGKVPLILTKKVADSKLTYVDPTGFEWQLITLNEMVYLLPATKGTNPVMYDNVIVTFDKSPIKLEMRKSALVNEYHWPGGIKIDLFPNTKPLEDSSVIHIVSGDKYSILDMAKKAAAAAAAPAPAPEAKRIVFKKVIEGDTLYYADPEGIKWTFYRDDKGVFILRGPLPSKPQPIRHPNIIAVFGDNLLTLPMKEAGKPKTVIYTYNEKPLYLSFREQKLSDPRFVHVRDGTGDKSPYKVLYFDAVAGVAAAAIPDEPMSAAAAAAPEAIPKLSARSLSHPFYNYEIKEGEKILKATLILDNTKLFFVFEDKSIELPKFIDVEIDLQSRHKILRFEKDEKGDYKSLSDFESTPLEGVASPGEIYASLNGKTVKVEELAAAAALAAAPVAAPENANVPKLVGKRGL